MNFNILKNVKNSTTQSVVIVLVILAALSAIVLVPFFAIWSVNTLFNTTIPYTFWTWLAVMGIKAFLTFKVEVNQK